MLIVSLFRNPRQAVRIPADHPAQRTLSSTARTEAPLPAAPVQARHRLTLTRGNAILFNSPDIGVRILSGGASLIHTGGSVELAAGEEHAFSGLPEGLTIQATSSEPLVFEAVLDTASDDHQRLKQQFYACMAGRLQLLDAEYTAGNA
ncbi:MAG: hypothetical protein JNL34_14845 [Anaerolineae bacterium]|nr:hypothetical protein [Anaerolineae bacterium]